MPDTAAGFPIEVLEGDRLEEVRPLLLDLLEQEQAHYPHRQLSRGEIEAELVGSIRPVFAGENVIFAVRDDGGAVVGFCWIVLFDPGTGLEGEVAEVCVAEGHRRHGIGEVLMEQAVRLFRERGVTLGYVWTRPDNEAAVRLYRSAGFEPSRQLVLTWYPVEPNRS